MMAIERGVTLTMVARHDVGASATERPPRLSRRLFDTWRLMLGVFAETSVSAITCTASAIRRALVVTYHMVSGHSADVGSRQAIAHGVTAVGIGTAGAATVHAISGANITDAIALAFTAALWPVARLFVMRLLAPRYGVENSTASFAWGSGTLPFAIAMTPVLRFAAWLVGARIGYRALRDQDVDARSSRNLVMWAWGIEILGAVLIWLTRGVPVIILAGG